MRAARSASTRAPRDLFCPCHGATFDPKNHGAVLAGPTNIPLPEVPIHVDAQTGVITLAG